MKLRRTMKAEIPKRMKRKEIIIIKKKKKEDLDLVRPEDMQQGSRSGQRMCSKKNQHQGPMYVQMYAKSH